MLALNKMTGMKGEKSNEVAFSFWIEFCCFWTGVRRVELA